MPTTELTSTIRPATWCARIALALACVSRATYMRRRQRRKVVRAHRRLKVRLDLLDKIARLRAARTAKDGIRHRTARGQRLLRAGKRRHVRGDVLQLLRRIHTRSLDFP